MFWSIQLQRCVVTVFSLPTVFWNLIINTQVEVYLSFTIPMVDMYQFKNELF